MTLLCPDCFGDSGLRYRLEMIRPKVGIDKCDYHPTKKGIPVDAIAGIVDSVFRQHYGVGDFHGYANEQAGDSLEFCVGEFTEANEEAAAALTEALYDTEHINDPESFYASDQNYVRYGLNSNAYQQGELWSDFCRSIKYDIRFFNDFAETKLKEIFDGIQYQKDQDLNLPVRRLGHNDKGNRFWRTRVVNSYDKRNEIRAMPALELGAPPSRLRKAGRMNSSGIRAFYGAFELETSLSEIRPIVGNKVMAAQFHLSRDVYVLDTTRFTAPIKPASVFNKSYEQRVTQWAFMQDFMDEISAPISPSDTHLDYIPTQVVAEYLVHRHRFKRNGKEVSIEGLIFKSAQNPGGKNIVLFGDAARAVLTKEEAELDSKRNSEYAVQDWVSSWFNEPKKQIPPALKIDTDSILVKEVTSAKYPSRDHIDYEYNSDF